MIRSVALAAVLLAAPAATALAQSTAVQTVDVMNSLWGRHPGQRANHAKGVVAEGRFTPSPGAAALSAAAVFAGGDVPVTVRFSNSTGLPALADGAAPANPHGMAIKFQPPGGTEMDLVINSLGFFPVATGEAFLELLQALAASGPEVAKPTPADRFIAAHPSVPLAFGTVATPSSYGREAYNGVNAFVFVNAAGARQAFRWRFEPVAGVEHLSPEAAAALAPDALSEELRVRLGRGPVAFRVLAQLAAPGDQTRDSSQPWPADRQMADMGTLTLTRLVADNDAAQRALRFLPSRLQPGVQLSDDPMVAARVQSYVISFGRRAQ